MQYFPPKYAVTITEDQINDMSESNNSDRGL